MRAEELTLELVEWVRDAGMAGDIPKDRLRAYVSLGRFSPEMLAILQCKDLELRTTIAVLEKMLFDHAISPKHLYGLNGLICQPEKVFKSKTRPDTSVVVMTIETLRALPIVVPIELNKTMAQGKAPVHWVSSAYAKDEPEALIRWEKEGLLLWKHR